MNPNQLNLLREKLKGVAPLPGQSDILGEYVQTLAAFSAKMDEIQTILEDAQSALASGNTKEASSDLQQLIKLREEAGELLQSLTVLIDRLSAQYEIDLTVQQQRVRQFASLYRSYSVEVDQLNASLKAQQGFVPTTLSLNSTKLQAFVNETIPVFGFLKSQNGTALTARNVIITLYGKPGFLRVTDSKGRFAANISFPVGISAGPAIVEADYVPEGSDARLYLPSTTLLSFQVAYRPSSIAAFISPSHARPRDLMTIHGYLSTPGGSSLPLRQVEVILNGTLLGEATTSRIGVFTFTFSVPRTLNNGTHALIVSFPARGEVYAPSNVTLPFTVDILATKTLIFTDRNSLLSGMNLIVTGNVTSANGTAPTGTNVTIFLDNLPYRNVTINGDGSYLAVVQLPIWTSLGSHSIAAEYRSDRPWVQGSNAVAVVFIYNTPVILFVVVSIAAGSSLGFYLYRRGKRAVALAAVALPEPVAIEKPMKMEFSPESMISAIENETPYAARIRKSFFLAQAIIDQKIGESSRTGETHWEHFFRVTKSVPWISDTLKRLVKLYELAEYSPFPIEPAQSREATELLLELRQQIETVK
jgi:hypothetical protein